MSLNLPNLESYNTLTHLGHLEALTWTWGHIPVFEALAVGRGDIEACGNLGSKMGLATLGKPPTCGM